MGRLIPAGTGMARYLNLGVQIDAPPELLAAAGEVEELEVARPGAPPGPAPGSAGASSSEEAAL